MYSNQSADFYEIWQEHIFPCSSLFVFSSVHMVTMRNSRLRAILMTFNLRLYGGDTILDKSSLNSNLTNICILHVLNKTRSDVNVLNSNVGFFLFYHFVATFIIYVTHCNKSFETEYSVNRT
jgi:hypothetical protein